ncbi:MAG: metallophosphoesterase [Deltaproteobacteria bacterium]|nr:metallophosphoesterase [Deltaproteobacteria bacterium]
MILNIVIFLSVILVLVNSYVGWRVIGALRLVTNWNYFYMKWIVFAITIYFLIYPLLALLGSISGSQKLISTIREGDKVVDYFFMYPFWFGLVLILQLGVLFFCLEIIRFFISLMFKSESIRWVHAWLIVAITAVVVVYVPARIYLDTKTVRTEEVKVQIPNLPDALEGFKIVHISDIQADFRTGKSRMEKYINVANKLEPDIVVFTGDLVTYGEKHIDIGAEMIGKIKTKYGLYACLGDHDYWANPSLIAKSLKKQNVTILEDENFTLDVKSSEINMTFVTNIYSMRPNMEALKILPSLNTSSALKIFIVHQPSEELVEFASKNNYNIFLAGHTHGGQVVFSLLGIKLTPVLFENNYLSGQYRFGSMFININNGLGLTFAPIRYNAPAGVTLIRLEKEN